MNKGNSISNNVILVLTNSCNGLYSFRKEVMQSLLDKGYHVIISSPADASNHLFVDMGCEFVETAFALKGTNPFKDIALVHKYVSLLKQYKPLAVLSYTIKPNLYGGMACALRNVPQLANITGLGTAVENPGLMQKITIMLYKLGLRRTMRVFFQNQANRTFCINHHMIKKGVDYLIPGSGVNLHWHTFKAYPEDRTIKFLYIGRVMKEKGIDQFLDAARYITKKYQNTEFHILGGCSPDYESIIEKANNDGVVIYHGRQSDVRPYIEQSNCTIHASYYPEGMSNVLLETCAAGRAIITTDRPGCGEVIEDGINGYLVRQKDSQDVIEKVEKFINLPYDAKERMGKMARKKVEQEFDRQIVINAYLAEIEKIRNDK